MLATSLYGCESRVCTSAQWAPRRCRACERSDDRIGEALGIPGREFLNADGVCPACSREWPPVTVCHVCGGPASVDERRAWKLRGFSRPPEQIRFAQVLSLAVVEAELFADKDGNFPRPEVTQLLFFLYGHEHKRSSFHRWAWRRLLGAYSAGAEAQRRWAWDEEAPMREVAAEARAKAKAKRQTLRGRRR